MKNDSYNNGGEWLNAVFLTGPEQHLTGFVHAEDRFWVSGQGFTGNGAAFKSAALGNFFNKRNTKILKINNRIRNNG